MITSDSKDKELKIALSLLRDLQWHYEPYDDYYHKECGYYCPNCGNEDEKGHRDDCELGNLLSRNLELKNETND